MFGNLRFEGAFGQKRPARNNCKEAQAERSFFPARFRAGAFVAEIAFLDQVSKFVAFHDNISNNDMQSFISQRAKPKEINDKKTARKRAVHEIASLSARAWRNGLPDGMRGSRRRFFRHDGLGSHASCPRGDGEKSAPPQICQRSRLVDPTVKEVRRLKPRFHEIEKSQGTGCSAYNSQKGCRRASVHVCFCALPA